MLFTFLFEAGGAIYLLWRYKQSLLLKLLVATLTALAVFQLSEYMVCGGFNLTGGQWTRLGYISITLLPPLGIHILSAITKQSNHKLLALAYGSALLFAFYFLLSPGLVAYNECRPNYAVFHLNGFNSKLFALYYYGWLMIGLFLSTRWARTYPALRSPLLSVTLGYSLFIVPTTIANLIDPTTISGIPSIMCGFAVLLAIVIVTKVAPQTLVSDSPLTTKDV